MTAPGVWPMMSVLRRTIVPAVAIGMLALSLATVTAQARASANPEAAPAVAPRQSLVTLLRSQVPREAADPASDALPRITAARPLTRVRTVVPVLEEATAPDGTPWVRVALPGRPNGHSGWISTHNTERSSTPWHLVVDLSSRNVSVYRGGEVRRRFRAVVGAAATPTPRGHFFVEESVAIPDEAGGPYALALSSRSTVLQEFAGGPGQIAIHGVDGLQGAFRSAVSHGCIRLSTAAITWLAGRIDAGVPVQIKQ